jgi:hypothetical protein
MTLLILIVTTIVVGLFLGVLAKMPPVQIAAQCGVMCLGTLVFYGLVALL